MNVWWENSMYSRPEHLMVDNGQNHVPVVLNFTQQTTESTAKTHACQMFNESDTSSLV
jgi:hypothetical protein